jgi:hypothetical protein
MIFFLKYQQLLAIFIKTTKSPTEKNFWHLLSVAAFLSSVRTAKQYKN